MTILFSVLFGLTLGDWFNKIRFRYYKDDREIVIGTVVTSFICMLLAIAVILMKGA